MAKKAEEQEREFIVEFTTSGRGYAIVKAVDEVSAEKAFDAGKYDICEQEEWSVAGIDSIKENI